MNAPRLRTSVSPLGRVALLVCTWWCASSLAPVSDAAGETTLALIPAAGKNQPAAAVMNELEAAWVQQKNVALVERQTLAKILAEHQLTGAALVDAKARVQLGQFISADLLVFVDSVAKLPKPATRVQVTESKSGMVLASQILENEILLNNPSVAIDLIQAAMRKQAIPVSDRHVLGYLDFRSEEAGPLLNGTAAALGTLVITDLTRVPHIIVLEREYLSHLQVERDLTPLEQDLRTSVRLLEGGVRRGTDTNTLAVTILLRPLTGGAPLQIKLTVSARDINHARDQITQEIASQLRVKRPETTEADRAAEAQVFGNQATLLSAWGDRPRSIHAAETAFALSPSQTNRWLVARMLTEGQTSLAEAIRGNDLLLDYYRIQANAISTGGETNRALPTLGYWMELPAREDSVAERKQLDELEERVFRFRLDHYRTYYETMSNDFWNTWIDRLEALGPYHSGDRQRQMTLLREAYATFLQPPAHPDQMSGERLHLLGLLPQCVNGMMRWSRPGHWLRPLLGGAGERREIHDPPLPREFGRELFEEFTQHADPYVRLVGWQGLRELNYRQPHDVPGWLSDQIRFHQEILRIVAEDIPPAHPYRKASRAGWGPDWYGEFLLIKACGFDAFGFRESPTEERVQKELDLYVRILRDMISTGAPDRIGILEQMASLHLQWLDHLDKNGRLNDAVELARGLVEILKKDPKRNFHGYQALADRLAFYERLAHLQPDTSTVANTNAVNSPMWDEYEILPMDFGLTLRTSHYICSRSSLLMTSDGNRLYCVQPMRREGAVDLRLTTHWLPTGSMIGATVVATRIPLSRNERSGTTWIGTVYAIALGGDTVYVGTRAGLAAISLKTRHGKLLTPEQGLPGPIVRALTWHQGKLYLGIGADPYNHQIDGLSVFAAYDPATARFEVIAAEKAVSRENSWNGMKFQIDDILTDEPGNCLWIKERKTGIWKFTPASGTLTNVAAMIPRAMLVGSRFVGHPYFSSISPGYVTFFAPPNLTPRRLADPVGGLSLISESAAVELDGDNVIAAANGRKPSGKQRVLFIQKPDGKTAPLALTPAGKPFPGALHLHKSAAGIVAVAEDGQAFLLRRKDRQQEYRLAELQAASGNTQETALLEAADRGDISQIESLLATGVNIKAVDRRGFAPLHYALHRRHSDAALLLIQRGSDINQRTEQGSAPLALAAEADDVAVVQRLLDRRVSVDAVDRPGRTALWYAARSGATNAARLLIAAGADVQHRGATGLRNTVLMESAGRGQLESVKLLLQHGAQLEGCDNNGHTALNRAANSGQSNVVRYLIQHGANVNVTNERGWTALMQAVEFNQLESVQLLIEGGADVNAVRSYGKTALMDAAADSTIEIVQCLLEHGAKVSAVGDLQWTALRHAELKKRYDVVLLLRRALEAEKQEGKP